MSATADRSSPLPVIYGRLARAQKDNTGVALYSRWINRPLGRLLAVLAFRVGMTPNQVTALSAVFTFGGIVLLAAAPPSWLVAGAVTALLVLGYALDSADGQVARLSGTGGPAGEWLDHVIDASKVVTIHVAVLVHWYRYLDLPPAALAIPLLFAVVYSVWFFAEILTQMLERLHPEPEAGTTTRRRLPLQPVLALPADYGAFAATFLLLAVPSWWVPLYSVLAVLNLLMLFRQLRSWYRRVNALTRGPNRVEHGRADTGSSPTFPQ